MQIDQLPTDSYVELEDNSKCCYIILRVFIIYFPVQTHQDLGTGSSNID